MSFVAPSISRPAEITSRRTAFESGGLFVARVIGAAFSFIVNVYLARRLGVDSYGTYALVVALLTYISLFCDFGYFASGARVIANLDDRDDQRRWFGTMLSIAGISALALGGLLYGLGHVLRVFFPSEVGGIVSALAVTSPALVAPHVMEHGLKALGKLPLMAAWEILSRALMIPLLMLFGLTGHMNAHSAGLSYTLASVISLLVIGTMARPLFDKAPDRLRHLLAEQRSFGRPLYAGRLSNLAAYNSDKLLLGYFHGPMAVGHYTLVTQFASLGMMFCRSLVVARFREFAGRRPISRNILLVNWLGALFLGAASVFGAITVLWFLGDSFAPARIVVWPAVLAALFQGAYQPYNSWLLANGLGLELRRFLVVNATINVGANFMLIPPFGAFGAAMGTSMGTISYLHLARSAYRREIQ